MICQRCKRSVFPAGPWAARGLCIDCGRAMELIDPLVGATPWPTKWADPGDAKPKKTRKAREKKKMP